MTKRLTLKLMAAGALVAASGIGFAQDVIKIANIVELSGTGATSGTNFRNGVELAVKEINAAGGILGKKIQTTTADTTTNPGVAKGLTQKAIDDGVFAIFGPVFSGSIMVSMAESQKAQVPNFTGGDGLLRQALGHAGVGRGVGGRGLDFLAQNAASGVDFFDRQLDAVPEIGARGGAGA